MQSPTHKRQQHLTYQNQFAIQFKQSFDSTQVIQLQIYMINYFKYLCSLGCFLFLNIGMNHVKCIDKTLLLGLTLLIIFLLCLLLLYGFQMPKFQKMLVFCRYISILFSILSLLFHIKVSPIFLNFIYFFFNFQFRILACKIDRNLNLFIIKFKNLLLTNIFVF